MAQTDILIDHIINTKIALNRDLVEASVNGVIDYFASSLLARAHEDMRPVRALIEREGGIANYWLIGTENYATSRQAALYNGLQAHLLDIDDVHEEVRGHPSAVILTALISQISFCESIPPITGERFLSAYIIGVEVMARLGVAVGENHYIKGWHNTSTLGGIAATAALCHLHQFPQAPSAMSLAASQASGLRVNFGSVTKPLHVGLAAQQAVQSIELCRFGIRASQDFLDDELGFFAIFGEKSSQLNLDDWGDHWRILAPGLWFKNYPYCSANSFVVDAIDELLHNGAFSLTSIQKVIVTFSYNGDAALIYTEPTRKIQGKFSAEYVIAKRLQRSPLDEGAFNDELISSATKLLMKKIIRKISPKSESKRRFVEIKIIFNDGTDAVTKTVYHPKGSPQNPYSRRELQEKLRQSIGGDKSKKLYHQIGLIPISNSMQKTLLAIKNCLLAHEN